MTHPTLPAHPKPAPDAACPFLGISSDPATRFVFPSAGHRCFAAGKPVHINETKQARDCLTPAHPTCSLFVQAPLKPTVEQPQEPARLGGRRMGAVLVAIVLILLVGGGALAATGNLPGVGPSPTAEPTAEPTPEPTAEPTPQPTPAPTHQPTPQPTLAPAPTESASAAPTPIVAPSPAPTVATQTTGRPGPGQFAYPVQHDDTLVEIANRFGVTVAAIVKLNGLADKNVIITGTTLQIPAL